MNIFINDDTSSVTDPLKFLASISLGPFALTVVIPSTISIMIATTFTPINPFRAGTDWIILISAL